MGGEDEETAAPATDKSSARPPAVTTVPMAPPRADAPAGATIEADPGAPRPAEPRGGAKGKGTIGLEEKKEKHELDGDKSDRPGDEGEKSAKRPVMPRPKPPRPAGRAGKAYSGPKGMPGGMDDGGGGGADFYVPYVHPVPHKVATIASAPARVETDAARAAADALRARVEAEPHVRAHREALVKRLVKLGRYDDARVAAEAWLAADADSPLPLEYLGDLALQAGDHARALRLYDSLAELAPQDRKLHERLARMHATKGDAMAGCAHLRAALELARPAKPFLPFAYRDDRLSPSGPKIVPAVPGAAKEAIALARCEDGSSAEAARKAKKAAGELAVELTWDGPVDLDLALVPPKADRLSVLKELRGLSVRDARSGAEGAERMVARELGTGTYLVVASVAGGALAAPVSGKIVVKARGSARTLPFTLPAGVTAAELASVRASTIWTHGLIAPDPKPSAGRDGVIYR